MTTNNADPLDMLEDFAWRRRDNEVTAGLALARFLRGECDHRFRDESGCCELCGDEISG